MVQFGGRLRIEFDVVSEKCHYGNLMGLDQVNDSEITEAKKLLELARLVLNNDAECLAYEFVIANFKDCPIFEKTMHCTNSGLTQ